MEKDINGWLNFAGQVSKKLELLGDIGVSNEYVQNIHNLIDQISTLSHLITDLSLVERHEVYLKINMLGSELKSVAYFAN